MNFNYSRYKEEHFFLPYILISGSYKDNENIDNLCKILGLNLSKLEVGIISGAGKAGLNVSHSFCEMLELENKYEPDKIVFYFRRKEADAKAEVPRIGSIKFFGAHSLQMRRKMISRVSAVILIGGKAGTIQEEQLARIRNIPVIPIAITGGAALQVWENYKSKPGSLIGGQAYNASTFDNLNNENIQAVADAAYALLKKSLIE